MKCLYIFSIITFRFLFCSLDAMELSKAEQIESKQEELLLHLSTKEGNQIQKILKINPCPLTMQVSQLIAKNFVPFFKHISGETLDEFATEFGMAILIL